MPKAVQWKRRSRRGEPRARLDLVPLARVKLALIKAAKRTGLAGVNMVIERLVLTRLPDWVSQVDPTGGTFALPTDKEVEEFLKEGAK